MLSTLETIKQAMIAGVYREDMAVATGSKFNRSDLFDAPFHCY